MSIKVTLVKPSDRRFFLARWNDPITDLIKTLSTKCTVRREAERFAARLEDELNSSKFQRSDRITWAEFRKRYKEEVSAGKAKSTGYKTESMFNRVESEHHPKYLSAVANENFISMYAAKMRESQARPFTIRGHLAELRKVLIWAKRMGLTPRVPHIEMPTTVSKMKGRAPTAEEFERIMATVEKSPEIVEPEFVEGWKHYLEGMWLSGLRMTESMLLHWTDDSHLAVDFSHKRPMFRIQAHAEKGRRFRLLPMTPDFAEFLAKTPVKERRRFVFNPLTRPRSKRKGSHRPLAQHVGKVVTALGKKAKVKVADNKFASLHDFRRAFGFRWAKLVLPQILQELMRHEDIKTTQQFYIGELAESAADIVWQAYSNTSGNKPADTHSSDSRRTTKRRTK